MKFQDLDIDSQIAYASWVACIGNEVLEHLHAAKRAHTEAERTHLQGMAYEALARYQTATIEAWMATLEQPQETPNEPAPDSEP